MGTLVIAGHPDDEVLGCGGMIAKLTASGEVVQVVFASDGESSRFTYASRDARQVQKLIARRRTQAIEAARIMGTREPIFLDYPDNRLDAIPALEITQRLEEIYSEMRPARVVTHHWSDLNVDHRVLNEVTQVMVRSSQDSPTTEVLFFELPSSTEWRLGGTATFSPDVFVNVAGFVDVKLSALDAYGSEMRDFPHPRSQEAIQALMEWRGAMSGYQAAEAFKLGKMRVN